MKRVFSLFLTLIIVLSSITFAYADSGSISADTSSIKITVGSISTFNITANNAAGRINIISNDESVAAVDEENIFLDNESKTINVKGIKAGTCKVTITYVDCSTYSEERITGSEEIRVTVNNPSQPALPPAGPIAPPPMFSEEQYSGNIEETLAATNTDTILTEEDVKKLISNIKVTVRTENDKKGIKIYVCDIDELHPVLENGYNIVYDFYSICQNKKPKNSDYIITRIQNKCDGWYLNTSVKKNKTYYYKTVVKVLDSDNEVIGSTTLAQAKYGKRTRK